MIVLSMSIEEPLANILNDHPLKGDVQYALSHKCIYAIKDGEVKQILHIDVAEEGKMIHCLFLHGSESTLYKISLEEFVKKAEPIVEKYLPTDPEAVLTSVRLGDVLIVQKNGIPKAMVWWSMNKWDFQVHLLDLTEVSTKVELYKLNVEEWRKAS